MNVLRALIIFAGLLLLWQLVVSLSGAPPYILPGPLPVAEAFQDRFNLILQHAMTTFAEIILGLLIGTLFGATTALLLSWSARVRPWLLPVLVISQAVPVFALAPVLVLWLGYGMASKVAMAALIIFFPVTAAMFDGLRRTDPLFIDCARTLGAGRLDLLLHVRLPAALPAFASGLRVATAVAPIGAVVGEWVGSSSGLGYLMLHANARLQIDLMFAALFTLSILAVALYYGIDFLLRAAMPWQAGEARPTAHTGGS